MPLWATTLLTLFLLMFAVPVVAMIAVLWIRLSYQIVIDLMDMDIELLVGDCLSIFIVAVFGTMIGWGAFSMGAFVIDGLIGRYVDAYLG